MLSTSTRDGATHAQGKTLQLYNLRCGTNNHLWIISAPEQHHDKIWNARASSKTSLSDRNPLRYLGFGSTASPFGGASGTSGTGAFGGGTSNTSTGFGSGTGTGGGMCSTPRIPAVLSIFSRPGPPSQRVESRAVVFPTLSERYPCALPLLEQCFNLTTHLAKTDVSFRPA